MAEQPLTREETRRKAALLAMDRFADTHGSTDRDWREVDEGDRICFVGKSDDGRAFWIGYMKEAVDRPPPQPAPYSPYIEGRFVP